MSEYTPLTENVRLGYSYRQNLPKGERHHAGLLAEFDRWLAAHDRDVAAAERDESAKLRDRLARLAGRPLRQKALDDAVAAERERCAQIARSMVDNEPDGYYGQACFEVATAIEAVPVEPQQKEGKPVPYECTHDAACTNFPWPHFVHSQHCAETNEKRGAR